jgi:hypothetical protein
MVIRLRQAKGQKDRYTMLSPRLRLCPKSAQIGLFRS